MEGSSLSLFLSSPFTLSLSVPIGLSMSNYFSLFWLSVFPPVLVSFSLSLSDFLCFYLYPVGPYELYTHL